MMCRADAADSIDETCARAGTRTWRLGVRLLTGPVGAAFNLVFPCAPCRPGLGRFPANRKTGCWGELPISESHCRPDSVHMSTILIIVVLVLLFGGGGFFWSRRGR